MLYLSYFSCGPTGSLERPPKYLSNATVNRRQSLVPIFPKDAPQPFQIHPCGEGGLIAIVCVLSFEGIPVGIPGAASLSEGGE